MMKYGNNVAAGMMLVLIPAVSTTAQINHCIGADGIHIYTDQGCNALDAYRAEDAPPELRSPRPTLPDIPDDHDSRLYAPPVHGCARELDELKQRLRDAVAARDHNELATLFHWHGATRYTADRVMPLLTQISRRPLHDISVITEYDEVNWVAYPVTLEIEQTDADLPDSFRVTRFQLMQSAGCWWMTF